MRYLTVGEVLEIYSQVMEQSGGGVGIHDLGALESAVAQPRMTFNGEELYPTIVEKPPLLGFPWFKNPCLCDGSLFLRVLQKDMNSRHIICGRDGNGHDLVLLLIG